MATVIYAPDFYTNPPKTAIPGARNAARTYKWAAADQLTTNILALGILPAGHRLMSLALECSDMDSATSHALSVGLLNSYYNQAEASVAAPGWDAYTGTIGIPVQVGSTSGATTPAEAAGKGGTTPILALGCNIITSSTVPQAGGRATATATLTPFMTLGVSQYDRIIALQFTAVGTAVLGYVGIEYIIDFP
jgi:hypothetical protein